MTQHRLVMVAVGRPHPLVNLDQGGVARGREGGAGHWAELSDTPGLRCSTGTSSPTHLTSDGCVRGGIPVI